MGFPPGALVVGNVAALTDHKDHRTLIEAARIVHDSLAEARFVVVGDGELREELQALARAKGLEGTLVFAGFRGDVDRLFPAFDVFCLSSHLEGLGTSLLDAMMFSRPIVATAAGGIPEAVTDGLNGRLVPPRDPRALAGALIDLLRDRELRERLGRSGREIYAARFTAARMVEHTLEVLEAARRP
jgi:glycosyltransferase involved in cell wall biosynthesis